MTDENLENEKWLVFGANNRLREAIAVLTGASKRQPQTADLAARTLVSALLDGADIVRSELSGGNRAFVSVLEEATTWPVRWFPHARDQKLQKNELRRLGYGKRAPLSVSRAWQSSPGTQWAYAYWHVVTFAKIAANAGTLKMLEQQHPNNVQSFRDGLNLPPLVSRKSVLERWHKAMTAHYHRHLPGEQFESHPDWANTKGGINKIHERLYDGLMQIAPAAAPLPSATESGVPRKSGSEST